MTAVRQLRALALILGTLLLVALSAYWWTALRNSQAIRDDTIAHASVHAQQLSDALAAQTEHLFAGIDLALQQVRDAWSAGDRTRFDSLARTVIATFPEHAILQVAILGSDGRTVYTSLGDPGDADHRDREYFIRHSTASDDTLQISHPAVGRTSGRWSIHFTRPVRKDGRFAGVAIVALDPNYLARSLRALQIDRTDAIALVHQDGTYLARQPDLEGALGRQVPKERPFLGPLAEPRGKLRVAAAIDQIQRAYAWTRLSRHPYVAVVGLNEAKMLAAVDERVEASIRRHVASTLVFLLLGGTAIVLLFRHALQQRQIADSENRLRSIVETSVDGIITVDERQQIVMFNTAAERMFGIAAADVVGGRLDRLLPERLRDLHGSEVESFPRERINSRPMGRTNPVVALRADGTEFPVEVAISKVVVDGRPLLTATVRDVTQRRKQEDELRESEMRWRFALEGAGDGVWDWDIANGTVHFSRRWKEMLGFAEDEIGNGLAEWETRVHPDDKEKTLAAVRAYLDGETRTYIDEHRVRCKDGSYRWILDRGMVVSRDSDGRPLRMIGTHTDITTLHDAMAALRSAGQLNRAIIASAREGIIVYDADLRYKVWNDYMAHFTGLHAADVLGRHPVEVFPFLETSGVVERLQRALAGAMPEPVEFPFEVPATGARGWASDQCAPLRDADGRIVGVIGTVHDITRIKAVELQLREANEGLEARVAERTRELEAALQRAESASRAKSAFLANTSHEMRTPMTAIIGMTDLLRQEPLAGPQADRLARIDDAARHLLGIIDDLLDLARIEAGKMPIESVPFSLDGLLSDALELVRHRAEQKGLAIAARRDGVADRLIGDPQRLRQALVNYLTNAVKFTTHGSVEARVRIEMVPGKPRGDDPLILRFEVRDTGPGIPIETQARLFTAFEQADKSFTRQHGGTGLGLAIVRQLAQLMGGRTGVESREGVGSTFWFTAAVRLAEVGTAPTPAAMPTLRPGSLAGRRVLVVDDDPINREVIDAMLETLDLAIDHASDGIDAVRRVAERPYDLVLMDLHMPRMSGLDATREIRRHPNGRELPIVALTGDSPVAVAERCREAGMNDVVGKPFRLEDLVGIAQDWIGAGTPPAT